MMCVKNKWMKCELFVERKVYNGPFLLCDMEELHLGKKSKSKPRVQNPLLGSLLDLDSKFPEKVIVLLREG